MEFFKVVSTDKAKNLIEENFKKLRLDFVEVDIDKAYGKVLKEDIISDINVPEFNRSTVDGYAVKSIETHGANENVPSFLSLVGEVKMGQGMDVSIKRGQAIYVPTGGMIPEGSDSVVMIEHAEKLDSNTIAINKPVTTRENVILKGDDIKKGQIVLKKGLRLRPQDIGVLSAIGKIKVKVCDAPKFYVISTGDEIIDINEKLEIGKVRDINGYTLCSLIEKLGGRVVGKSIVKDNFKLLKSEVDKALNVADVILISGGSSVGVRDFTYSVIDSFEGEGVFIHGISIKPGKPTLVGEAKEKAIFGLPGHPVSSIIVFKVLVEHLVKQMMNLSSECNKMKAIIDTNFHSSPGKETYHMVTIEEREGKLYAKPKFGKSGMITLLSDSSGYIIIAPDEEGVNKGEERDIYFI